MRWRGEHYLSSTLREQPLDGARLAVDKAETLDRNGSSLASQRPSAQQRADLAAIDQFPMFLKAHAHFRCTETVSN